jgi:hypothetical protein
MEKLSLKPTTSIGYDDLPNDEQTYHIHYDDHSNSIVLTAKFMNPSELPAEIKSRIKPSREILQMMIDRCTIADFQEWLVVFDAEEVRWNMGHFFTLICRKNVDGGFSETGAPDSYEKAVIILESLIQRKYKWNNTPFILSFSLAKKKIELVKKALLALGAPLNTVRRVKYSQFHSDSIIDDWNSWLDQQRDPGKIGELIRFVYQEREEREDKPRRPQGKPAPAGPAKNGSRFGNLRNDPENDAEDAKSNDYPALPANAAVSKPKKPRLPSPPTSEDEEEPEAKPPTRASRPAPPSSNAPVTKPFNSGSSYSAAAAKAPTAPATPAPKPNLTRNKKAPAADEE